MSTPSFTNPRESLAMITTTTRLTLAAVLIAAPAAFAQLANRPMSTPPHGPYLKTCQQAKVVGETGNTLTAMCPTRRGELVEALVIIPCAGSIDNFNGNLHCVGNPPAVPKGSYLETCRMSLTEGSNLRALCGGNFSKIALPCAGDIRDVNGKLTCAAPAGAPPPRPDPPRLKTGAPPPNGPYLQSCKDARVTENNVLLATCLTRAREEREAMLWPLPCRGTIGNFNGNLHCVGDLPAVPEGPYLETCPFSLIDQNAFLRAGCRAGENLLWSKLALPLPCPGSAVQNVNAKLVCAGPLGVRQ